MIKMLLLIFIGKWSLIFTRVETSPKPSSSYDVDDGHRRSAKGRAEGISSAACRRACEDFRQTDCDLTQLWKAKAPKEQLLNREESLRLDNRARHYENIHTVRPCFFITPGQREDNT